jgi:hypothetical protein
VGGVPATVAVCTLVDLMTPNVPYEEQLRVAIRINNAYDIAQIDYQKNKLGYTHETSI